MDKKTNARIAVLKVERALIIARKALLDAEDEIDAATELNSYEKHVIDLSHGRAAVWTSHQLGGRCSSCHQYKNVSESTAHLKQICGNCSRAVPALSLAEYVKSYPLTTLYINKERAANWLQLGPNVDGVACSKCAAPPVWWLRNSRKLRCTVHLPRFE